MFIQGATFIPDSRVFAKFVSKFKISGKNLGFDDTTKIQDESCVI